MLAPLVLKFKIFCCTEKRWLVGLVIIMVLYWLHAVALIGIFLIVYFHAQFLVFPDFIQHYM